MSRRKTLPSFSSSRQMMTAWKVSGLSHRPGDHRLAAGLDPFGDGDLALAREQPYRAHLAQIHAHRVVGALDRLASLGFGRRLRRDLDQFARLGFLVGGLVERLLLVGRGLLGLDHVDAHLVELRQNVLDLLGSGIRQGYDRIELFVGGVAALHGLLDHFRDGGVGEIEQRQRGIRGLVTLLPRFFLLRRSFGLVCHQSLHARR